MDVMITNGMTQEKGSLWEFLIRLEKMRLDCEKIIPL
jgi:hypothetical protein